MTVTSEQLTLRAQSFTNGGLPRKPVEGFVEMVNAILTVTKTSLEDWSLTGQENTNAVETGHFSFLYLKGDGFAFDFNLKTGLFEIDCKQMFATDADGLIWWWNNAYPEYHGKVQGKNPELIKAAKPSPRKGYLSSAAKKSIERLVALAK